MSTLYWTSAIVAGGGIVLSLSYQDKRAPSSFLLRPPLLPCIASAVATLTAARLSPELSELLLPLRVLEAAGLLAGFAVATVQNRSLSKTTEALGEIAVNTRTLWLLLLLSSLAATLFFLLQGVPLLAGNVESARVEAATTGTGYLRLAAYLNVVPAILLTVRKARNWQAAFLISLMTILALANRSPLVYLAGTILCATLLMSTSRRSRRRVFALLALSVTVIVALGVFRVASQSEFASYSEYAGDLREGNYLGIASTTVAGYATVVGENGALVRTLYDKEAISTQFGSTYLTLFITALPGEQLTLDREIRLLSGARFIGGGTPPTLSGEALVNFGYVGVFVVPFILSSLLCIAYSRFRRARDFPEAIVYSYLLIWFSGSQVAGIAGASTVPMAIALTLLWLSRRQAPATRSRVR